MNIFLSSSPYGLLYNTNEGAQYTYVNFLWSRQPGRVSCFKKNNVQVISNDARKMTVSGQVIPSHLEDSFKSNERLQMPIKKARFLRTLLIDNYDSYTYNIYQELSVVNGGMLSL